MSNFRAKAYSVPVLAESVQRDYSGFTFDTYRDPPGQVWANFMHRQDEFIVVAEGWVEIEVGAERMLCSPGDLVHIPAGVDHSLRTTHDAPSVWHYGYGHFRGSHD